MPRLISPPLEAPEEDVMPLTLHVKCVIRLGTGADNAHMVRLRHPHEEPPISSPFLSLPHPYDLRR